MRASSTRPIHTYSIVARDPETGEMGVAVQSHAFSVGAAVPWVESGVGAVATQSLTRIDYGPEGLALMRHGMSARQALGALLKNDENRDVRQVAMVDARGGVAAHTGTKCIAAAGHLIGDGFSVQANLMLDESVWPAMKEAYESAEGELADRLIVALEAAQEAGGDIRGQQSAALLVVSGERSVRYWEGRSFDLRVEDFAHPVAELRRLVQLQRAYRYADRADELMAVRNFEDAMGALSKAAALAPGVVELRFWAAASLFSAGKEDEALTIFREVFAKEPIWAQLAPRLVPLGLLPEDPVALARIAAQRIAGG
jgi:uncharacterized Ntn-hydrolase superfamily protein